MRIQSFVNDFDPKIRRRNIDKDQKLEGKTSVNTTSETSETVELDSKLVEKYVDILKNMDPTNLHNVEQLKSQIANGEYTGDMSEMIDPLMDFLE